MSNGAINVDYLDRGLITIDGEEFREDMIVTPGKVLSWRRSKPLTLSINDFQTIISQRPAYLIVGIGIDDNLQLDDFTLGKLKDLGFEVYTAKTRTAVKKYNRVCDERKSIGLFHIS